MALENDAILAINAAAAERYAASATDGAAVMAALGAPGTKVAIADQLLDSGAALGADKTLQVLAVGLARAIEPQLGQVASIKAKVNELIVAYNALRADYNNGVVPTSAPWVDTL